jgi:hypothetical protein
MDSDFWGLYWGVGLLILCGRSHVSPQAKLGGQGPETKTMGRVCFRLHTRVVIGMAPGTANQLRA